MERSEIARLLPSVYQRTVGEDGVPEGGPLAALLSVMEGLHAPAEDALDGLDRFLDPRRAPDPFVPYLGQWVGLMPLISRADGWTPEALEQWPGSLDALRELVARAAQLSRWRGTPRGLVHVLETATGVAGFRVEERVADDDGRARPFHVRVEAPEAAAAHAALIDRIVETDKPAHVTYEVLYTS